MNTILKMMSPWSFGAVHRFSRAYFRNQGRHPFVVWGWFFLFALMAWYMAKYAVWFWVVLALTAANLVTFVVGLVLAPFVYLFGVPWGRLAAWYRGPLTTDEVEQWFSYYRRPGSI